VTDWGVHLFDIVQWAMGVDYPQTIALKKNVFQFGRQALSKQFYFLTVLRMKFSGNVNLKGFALKTILFFNCFEGARTSGSFEGKYFGRATPSKPPEVLAPKPPEVGCNLFLKVYI